MLSQQELLSRLEVVRPQANGSWMVRCPSHRDRTPSLHITLGDDRWLMYCHAGCSLNDVREAVGLGWDDLFAERLDGNSETVATYSRRESAADPPADTDGGATVGDRYRDRVLDVAAMLAAPEEPIPWRCEGFAADGFLTVLAGRGKEGKSWLALTLAHGVARGKPAAGFRCELGRALIFDAENGAKLIARRFRAAGIAPPIAIQPVEASGLRITDDLDWFQSVVAEQRANLVIFDSLRVLATGTKENSSDEVEPVITALKLLARETGAAVVLVHHRGRSEKSEFRGSSVILDQTDLLFRLERIEGDPEARTRRRLSTVGCRIDEEPPPRWLTIKADRNAGVVHVEEAEPYEGDGPGRPRERDRLRDRVLALLDQTPRSGRSIAEALGRSPDDGTTKRVLNDLRAEGLADHTPSGWVGRNDNPYGDGDSGPPPGNGSSKPRKGGPQRVARHLRVAR